MENGKLVVYVAGPMFSPEDQSSEDRIATTLRDSGSKRGIGFTTFLPQHDGIEVKGVMKLLSQSVVPTPVMSALMLLIRQTVFALDVFQVWERCDALVFNMDGRVPDEGGVSETALAFARGKPVVIYKQTPISILAGTDNPLVSGLGGRWRYVLTVGNVPRALREAIKEAGPLNGSTPPANVKRVLEVGRVVWRGLQWLHTAKDAEVVPLVEAFAAWVSPWIRDEKGRHELATLCRTRESRRALAGLWLTVCMAYSSADYHSAFPANYRPASDAWDVLFTKHPPTVTLESKALLEFVQESATSGA